MNYQYHGANRLGANALLSCLFDGLFCGEGVVGYVRDRSAAPASQASASMYDDKVRHEESRIKALLDSSGGENPYQIAKELGAEMTAASTVVKSGPRLEQALAKLDELRDRYKRLTLSDTGSWANQNLNWARVVGDMLVLADPILRGGLGREESRGSHFREDFTQRNDERFLKTTVASFDETTGRSRVSYEPVEIGLVVPRARTYGKVQGGANPATPAETQQVSAS